MFVRRGLSQAEKGQREGELPIDSSATVQEEAAPSVCKLPFWDDRQPSSCPLLESGGSGGGTRPLWTLLDSMNNWSKSFYLCVLGCFSSKYPKTGKKGKKVWFERWGRVCASVLVPQLWGLMNVQALLRRAQQSGTFCFIKAVNSINSLRSRRSRRPCLEPKQSHHPARALRRPRPSSHLHPLTSSPPPLLRTIRLVLTPDNTRVQSFQRNVDVTSKRLSRVGVFEDGERLMSPVGLS